MTKTQKEVVEKWGELTDLQKQLLQALAALAFTGAEIELANAAAGAFLGKLPDEKAAQKAWKALDADAKIWFVKNRSETHRKLRATALKMLTGLREETPGWTARSIEKIFDAFALLASDDLFAGAAGYRNRVALLKNEVFDHLYELRKPLSDLRFAETDALLASRYGLAEKKDRYEYWRDQFAARVAGTPLPQSPLLFLGLRPELFPNHPGVVFNLVKRMKKSHVWREMTAEQWDAEKAARLAEYNQTEVPGESASVNQTLVLLALAARPVYEEQDDLEEAARRLGKFELLLPDLPVLPPAPGDKARLAFLRKDFVPLAFALEDCAGEIGPATRLRLRQPELATPQPTEDDEDFFFGSGGAPLEVREAAKQIFIEELERIGQKPAPKPRKTVMAPLYRGGSGAEAVEKARAAYPEILKKVKKKCNAKIVKRADEFLRQIKEARADGVIDNWLETISEKAGQMLDDDLYAEYQYVLLQTDLVLVKVGVSMDELSPLGAEYACKLRMMTAWIELEVGETEHAFDLARGFAETLGAENERAWQTAQRELALFFGGNGYPGRAAAYYRRWLDWESDQPPSPELRHAKMEAVVEYASMLAKLRRFAAAERVCLETMPEVLLDSFAAIEEYGDLVYSWGGYAGWLTQTAALGVLPDYAPVMGAFESRLETMLDGQGAFVVPPLRLLTHLTLRAARADDPQAVADGLLSISAYLRQELPEKVGADKLKPREIVLEEEPLLAFAATMFALEPEYAAHMAETYPLDLMMAALCVYEIQMAAERADRHYPEILRETAAAPKKQNEKLDNALKTTATIFKKSFKKIGPVLKALDDSRNMSFLSGLGLFPGGMEDY